MRQHRLALCKPHFLDWMAAQTAETIEKFRMFRPGERVLVAVSGGKDSLSLWDVLYRLGYTADGLYIHLGIQTDFDYSGASEQAAVDFAAARGLNLKIVNLRQTYGEDIAGLSARQHRAEIKPCSVCGLVKRRVMNQAAVEGGYAALATGHNLDDEAAVLLANTMEWKSELLRRQYPVLEAADGFARKVKPFCRFYERDTAAYALLAGIAYVEEECPFSERSKQLEWKSILNRWEDEHPGRKFQFYINFLHARKAGLFAPPPAVNQENRQRCPKCGQPTASQGLCAFCRLLVEDR